MWKVGLRWVLSRSGLGVLGLFHDDLILLCIDGLSIT